LIDRFYYLAETFNSLVFGLSNSLENLPVLKKIALKFTSSNYHNVFKTHAVFIYRKKQGCDLVQILKGLERSMTILKASQ
jgi:3-deoxy-D-manno-octulosonate 8-phosphate phosphatase KdsC-like HAD superfamily phosphatase